MSNTTRASSEKNNNIRKRKKRPFVHGLLDLFDVVVVSWVIVITIFTFFIFKVEVDGNSMKNTLQNRDQLIATNFNYTPAAGDIIIISRNYTNSTKDIEQSQQPIVKRVIAVEGDMVEIKEGKVFVNDIQLNEPYLDKNLIDNYTPEIDFIGKQMVPENCVFVLGDNRIDSHDSRSRDLGFIQNNYILGKVIYRVFPFDSFKSFTE